MQGREQSEAECKCIHEDDIHRLLKSLLDGNGELPLIRRFDMTERTVEELAIIINGTENTPGLRTHWIETNASFKTIEKLIVRGIALGGLIAAIYGAYFAYLSYHMKVGESKPATVSSSKPAPQNARDYPTAP